MSDDKTSQTMTETERDIALKSHERMIEYGKLANEGAISIAIVAIKSLLLINGGAAVAMLGLVSALSGSGEKPLMIGEVVQPIILFAIGVAMAVISCGLAYAVMYLQAIHAYSFLHVWEHPYVIDGKNTRKLTWAVNAVQILTVIVAIVSMVLFIKGVLAVGGAIANLDSAGIT